MEKTIREIAEEFGVSKDKIKYQVKKLPSDWVKNRGNLIYVNDDGIRYLADTLGIKWKKSEKISPEFNYLENIIQTLENELKILQSQLEIKDKQIEELTRLLDQQQQLHMAEQKKVFLLTDKAETKKGLLSKFFKSEKENK